MNASSETLQSSDLKKYLLNSLMDVADLHLCLHRLWSSMNSPCLTSVTIPLNVPIIYILSLSSQIKRKSIALINEKKKKEIPRDKRSHC